jgi:hypothetical protein
MQKIFLIIFMAVFLGGCNTRMMKRPDREYVAPENLFMGMIDKEQLTPRAYRDKYFDHAPAPKNDPQALYEGNDDSYERGFQAGCQTFTSAIGEGLARIRGHNINADELTTNPWYLRGYQDAASYCTFALDWETH